MVVCVLWLQREKKGKLIRMAIHENMNAFDAAKASGVVAGLTHERELELRASAESIAARHDAVRENIADWVKELRTGPNGQSYHIPQFLERQSEIDPRPGPSSLFDHVSDEAVAAIRAHIVDPETDEGPFDPSRVIRAGYTPPVDPRYRIEELRGLMQDSKYCDQSTNISGAIALYESGELPDPRERLVSIQDGKRMPIDRLDLTGKPYWIEVGSSGIYEKRINPPDLRSL